MIFSLRHDKNSDLPHGVVKIQIYTTFSPCCGENSDYHYIYTVHNYERYTVFTSFYIMANATAAADHANFIPAYSIWVVKLKKEKGKQCRTVMSTLGMKFPIRFGN